MNLSKDDAYDILKANALQLTTHFDTHATLIWILEKMLARKLKLKIEEHARNEHVKGLFTRHFVSDSSSNCVDAGLRIENVLL
jgi:hypothetical protein